MKIKQKVSLSLLVVGMIVLFVAVNLLQGMLFGQRYIDLTTDKRYTLTQQTVDFLKNNDESIIIRMYQSKNLLKQNHKLGEYAEYLRKLLLEYKKYGGRQVDLSIIDVEPFTNTQVEAEKSGIKPFDFNDGKGSQYLGASFVRGDGHSETISRFYPDRMNSVEDDITRLLSVLVKDKKTTLGVISPFIKLAEKENILYQKDDYPFIKKLKIQGYEVISLSEKVPYISNDIDVVLLFYPLKLERTSIYAIDQYLMRGGRVLIMLDTFSEDRFKNKDEYISYDSGIQEFLQNIGVMYYENLLIGDNVNSRELVLNGKKIKYPFWIELGKNYIKNHPITENVDKLYINHGSFFDYQSSDGLVASTLLSSGNNTGVMKTEIIADMNINNLWQNYHQTNDNYPLAILLEGKFKSFFKQPLVFDKRLLSIMPTFLSIPISDGKLLLVADSDIINANLWQSIGSEGEEKDISDNFIFIRNALDYLSGNGYVSAGLKNEIKNDKSLSSVAYNMAAVTYNDEKIEVTKELSLIVQHIEKLKKSGDIKTLSIKQAKDIEDLKRKESAFKQKLQMIVYFVGKRYQNILSFLSVVLVLILPLLSVAMVYAVYSLYNSHLKKKAKELIDE